MHQHKKYYHMGIVEFRCDQCQKPFPTNNKLQLHIKIKHEGVKKFVCKYCQSAFSTNQNMKVHVLNSHGEDMFANGAPQRVPKPIKIPKKPRKSKKKPQNL